MDMAERRRLLDVAWHENGVYSDPVDRAEGREALISHIAGGSRSSSPTTASS